VESRLLDALLFEGRTPSLASSAFADRTFLFLHFMNGGLVGPSGQSNFLSARLAQRVQRAFAWIFILEGFL